MEQKEMKPKGLGVNDFEGDSYIAEIDKERLTKQSDKIWMVMLDGKWHTLQDIENQTQAPQASISSCLRNFRKKKWGSHTVDKRRVDDLKGTFEYKLTVNPEGVEYGLPKKLNIIPDDDNNSGQAGSPKQLSIFDSRP